MAAFHPDSGQLATDRATGQDTPEVREIDLGALEGKILARPGETWRALGCGPTKGYELLGTGELRSIKEGKARRILVSSIRSYLARRVEESRHSPPAMSPTRAAVAAAVAARIARKRRSTSDDGSEAEAASAGARGAS